MRVLTLMEITSMNGYKISTYSAVMAVVLLAFAIFVSFRSQRDVWVVVVAAGAILAAELKGDEQNRHDQDLRIEGLACDHVP